MKHIATSVFLTLFTSSVIAGGTHGSGHGDMKYSVGEPGKGVPDRIIKVSMRDSMRFLFTPEMGDLKHGETVEFRLTNNGQIRHEFSIGNAEDQLKHAKMMREMPGMAHSDPNTASLAPGESATLSWKFMGKDTVVFACNIPGHFEAGMKHILAIGPGGDDKLALN